MIRAAAKNHEFCAVVVRPESYDAILQELEEAAAGSRSARARASRPRRSR
jgi:AICAR transformylase/IMP cyclohydrolase PurH